MEGGVDILLPETSFDTLVLKACLFAIDTYFDETGMRLPVMASGTIFDKRPHALGPDGGGVLELDLALRRSQRRASTARGGRADARRTSESLAAICRTRISCYPNAGMPDGFGGFSAKRDETARALGEFAATAG